MARIMQQSTPLGQKWLQYSRLKAKIIFLALELTHAILARPLIGMGDTQPDDLTIWPQPLILGTINSTKYRPKSQEDTILVVDLFDEYVKDGGCHIPYYQLLSAHV